MPYGLDSNVTKLLADLLTKPSVFYDFANNIIVSCNLVSVIIIIIFIIIIIIIIIMDCTILDDNFLDK